jgi:hypothetical protein
LAVTLIGAVIGCTAATPLASRQGVADAVQGPGSVFVSIDEAATDALAWSYVLEQRDRAQGRIRAGVVSSVPGGFTYTEVMSAPVLEPTRVSIRLMSDDVAHFRYIPAVADHGANLANERHTNLDRQLVDIVDPLHRTSYLMSPDRIVRVYAGNGDEFVLGTLDDWLHRSPRWGKRPVVRVTEFAEGG